MEFENISASYDVGIAKKYGINSAVLLNKIMYLSKYTSRNDGYCWRTAKELEDELGLSRRQQELAIKKLEEIGYIETKNTYIIGTQIKCKHFKLLKSQCNKTCKCEINKSDKCDFYETCKSVNNNNTIINKHNNTYSSNINEYIEENFGRTISPIEYEKIQYWQTLYDEEVIKYAIQIAVLNRKNNFNYINGIIKNWKTNGYKTLEDIKQNENKKVESEIPEELKNNLEELQDYNWFEEENE